MYEKVTSRQRSESPILSWCLTQGETAIENVRAVEESGEKRIHTPHVMYATTNVFNIYENRMRRSASHSILDIAVSVISS